MSVPAKYWKNSKMFQPLENEDYCGEFMLPAGTFMIEKRVSSEYYCKCAVNKETNQIYFYRSST